MKLLFIAIFIIVTSNCFSQNNWDTFGSGVTSGSIRCFYEDTIDDVLIAGGAYKYIDGVLTNGLTVYNGVNWQKCHNLNIPLYGGLIRSIIRYNNCLYVSGNYWFTWNNETIPYIAKWDGTNWLSLPFTINSTSNVITDMRIINNKLFFLAATDTIPGLKTNHIIIYDGQNYSAFDNLPPNYVQMLSDIAYYKGEYYISGTFGNSADTVHDILKYNGTNWATVGGGIKGSGDIAKMLVYNDELVVAGDFFKSNGNASNNIMSWDGEKWNDFIDLSGVNNDYNNFGAVRDMKVHDNKLYIGGVFSYANDVPCQRILVYDGNTFCSFGNEMYNNCGALGFYHDTLIIAGIDSIDHIDVNRIAKWTGGNNYDTCFIVQNIDNIDSELSNFTVYPNPATNTINIKTNFNIKEYSIYNITGQKVQAQELKNNTINISYLPMGIYLLQLHSKNRNNSIKLIKN